MKKKTVLFITILMTLILFANFSITTSIKTNKNENIIEKSKIKINTDKTIEKNKYLIPRLIVASLIINHGFEIISAEADQINRDENGTSYVGHVKIKARLNSESYGYACSYIANKIGIRLINMGFDPSFLPGWYEFDEEFTIKARMFYLSNYVELEGSSPVIVGFGFLVSFK